MTMTAVKPMETYRPQVNSSKLVFNTSSNFQSLRIQGPNTKDPERDKIPSFILTSMPELMRNFTIMEKIGEGSFSKVFKARLNKKPLKEYALKCVIPTIKPERVANEIRYLRDLGGNANVMPVKWAYFNQGVTVIVMPYLKSEKFTEILDNLSTCEIRDYMKHLLIALNHIHKSGVIHRDIKPGNFLYNRSERKYLLADFGLAQKEISVSLTSQLKDRVHVLSKPASGSGLKVAPNLALNLKEPVFVVNKRKMEDFSTHQVSKSKRHEKENLTAPSSKSKRITASQRSSVDSEGEKVCHCFGKPQVCKSCTTRSPMDAPRAGTPGFRAPEVLFRYMNQTTAIDIWSAGVIFLILLSHRYPFFHNSDDLKSLSEIITLLGTKRVLKAATDLNRHLLLGTEPKILPAMNLKETCEKLRGDKSSLIVPNAAYDLLNRLLEPSPLKRLTADEALQHPFFHRL